MVIPAGYAQINHFFTGVALPRGAQVTYGVELDGTSNLATIGAALHTEWVTNFGAVTPTNVTLAKTRIKEGPNDVGPFIEVGTATAGTYAAAPDSPQVAMLVTKNTALGGRHQKGRLFLPLLAEQDSDSGGNISAAAQVVYQGALTAWLADVNSVAGVVGMVLLHADEVTAPTPVTTLVLSSKLATQRRRIRRVGGRRNIIP